MAQIQDRKGSFYSKKQIIRDELSAPVHLETAGDVLIKQLSKKQLKTCTTLQEQLETVQNFEKGFYLNPDNRKGVTCLEEYKNSESTQSDTSSNPPSSSSASLSKQESNLNLEELMKDTGLTRHELELGLSEKPHSAISQLYMFAIGNRKRKCRDDHLGSNHPLNQLKKIEEEYFGEKKTEKNETEILDKGGKKVSRKRKHRKRKRKSEKYVVDNTGKSVANSTEQSVDDSAEESEIDINIDESFEHNVEIRVAENVEKNFARNKEKSVAENADENFMFSAKKKVIDNTIKSTELNSQKNVGDNTGKSVEDITSERFINNREKNVAESTEKSVAISSNKMAENSENKIKRNTEKNDADSTGNCVALHSDPQTKRPLSPDETREHSRVSLWDVKDMKKWSECKKIGCKPPALYTIKNGKIIKLTEKSETETL